MKMFVDLCAALGFDVSRMDLMDAFTLAGHIIRDKEFLEHRRAGGTIYTLTPSQRVALRERVVEAAVDVAFVKS